MCWTSDIAIKKTAKRDFYVYKIGSIVDNYFVSLYNRYYYTAKKVNNRIDLIINNPFSSIKVIQKGYHSYKFVALGHYYINTPLRTVYLGSYNAAASAILGSFSGCVVATFIIPKGSEYYENNDGEIVSSNIIYTGKYVKL